MVIAAILSGGGGGRGQITLLLVFDITIALNLSVNLYTLCKLIDLENIVSVRNGTLVRAISRVEMSVRSSINMRIKLCNKIFKFKSVK